MSESDTSKTELDWVPAVGLGCDEIDRDRVFGEVTANLFGAVQPPTALARYVPLQTLGRGGFGRVLRAHDPKLDRDVAIKLLHVTPKSRKANQRLVDEARVLAALAHPNVVEVFDVGTFAGLPAALREGEAEDAEGVFVVMELVDGPTLRQWLAEERDWRDALGVFLEAGAGLAAAHAVSIVHRDFKPANVMIGSDGRARVLDFGLAQVIDPSAVSGSAEFVQPALTERDRVTRLTESGLVVGTPAYMAPEQLAAERSSAASDQFSFCVALWEGLVGARPFAGDSIPALQRSVLAQQFVVRRQSDVRKTLLDILRRGLRVRPEDRFPTMRALLEALERASSQRSSARSWLLGLGAVAAVGLVAASSIDTQPTEACERLAARQQAVSSVAGSGESSGLRDGVDAWSQRWSAAAAGVCEAKSSVGGPVFDSRLRCLASSVAEVERLNAALAGADEATNIRATLAVAEFSDPRACASAEPAAETSGAFDPAVEELIASARLSQQLGHYEDAELAAAEATETSEGDQYARAAYRVGATRNARSDFSIARSPLRKAYFAAQAVGYDEVALLAAVELTRAETKLASYTSADAWARHSGALLERIGETDAAIAFHLVRGRLELARSDDDAALEDFERGLELVRERATPDPVSEAKLLSALAIVDRRRGQDDIARGRLENAASLMSGALGPAHPMTGVMLHESALAVRDRETQISMLRRAQTIFSSSTGVSGLYAGLAQANLGNQLLSKGELIEAETLLRDALRIMAAKLGPQHPTTGDVHHMLGRVLLNSSRVKEAEEHFRKNVDAKELHFHLESPRVAAALNSLGQVFRVQERNDEAQSVLARTAKIYREVGPSRDRELSSVVAGLAEVAMHSHDHDRADTLYQQLLDLRTKLYPDDPTQLVAPLKGLAALASARDDVDGAVAYQERVTSIFEDAGRSETYAAAWQLSDLSGYYLDAGRPEDALVSAQRALEVLARSEGGRASIPRTRFYLARAKWELGDRRTAEREIASVVESRTPESPLRQEITAWKKRRGAGRPK